MCIRDSTTPLEPGTTLEFVTDNGGIVEISPDGTYVYTPPEGFSGTDEFEYTVCDDGGNCDTATVSIEVRDTENTRDPDDPSTPVENARNEPPIAGNDPFTLLVDLTQPVSSTDPPLTGNVLSNDGDPDGDPVTVTEAGGVPAGTPFTSSNGGTVVVNTDGTFEYTPPTTPGGTPILGTDSFIYTVTDDLGNTDTATVEITVTADGNGPGNDAPVAGNDAIIGSKGDQSITGNLLDNDVEPNGDPLTITQVNGDTPDSFGVITTVISSPDPNDPTQQITAGTLTVNPDGSYDFVPEPGFDGFATLDYEVCDDTGACDTATVSLAVFNQAPIAVDDVVNTISGGAIPGDVFDNSSDPTTQQDRDPNGDPLTVNPVPAVSYTHLTLPTICSV